MPGEMRIPPKHTHIIELRAFTDGWKSVCIVCGQVVSKEVPDAG